MNPVQLHTLVSVASVTVSVVESANAANRVSSHCMGSSSWEAAKSQLSDLQTF